MIVNTSIPASHVTATLASVAHVADTLAAPRVAVVVPCHRVKAHILKVVEGIPDFVECIYVVDDSCPEGSGAYVEEHCRDPRVRLMRNGVNLGVGGTVMVGYERAVADGMDIVVKMDGDDQMDGAALAQLIGPIVRGEADYTKGNRFYDLTEVGRMPPVRIFGNAVLSFMTKLSSGYWDIFDPTNGYTAIHAKVIAKLPLRKISRRFFFETDMLFRLNTIRAVVVDVPMDARYGNETSNLRISRIVVGFLAKHVRNTGKRLFYNYFLRNLSLASIELIMGAFFVFAGMLLGLVFWIQSFRTGVMTGAGSVMLVALPIIVGIQLLLGFLAYDIASVPRRTLHRLLGDR